MRAWQSREPSGVHGPVAAALVLACSIGLGELFPPQHPFLWHQHPLNYFDLQVYRGGGRLVLDGSPLYDTRVFHSDFTYPPASALLFTALAALPLALDEVLVSATGIAMLGATLWFALRLRPIPSWLDRRHATTIALLATAGALWLEPVRTTLGYGQIDLLIALLVVYDLSRPDIAPAKGVAIGIAGGLKLTPMIFAVYLLLSGRRRAAAWASCAFAATVALGFLVVPRDAERYWGGLFLESSRTGRLQNSANQSLRGALARLLHTVDVQAPWLLVAAVVGVAGLALAALACRRGDEAIGFALCAITGLLVSPVSWTHHWALAVPALLVLALGAHRRGSRAGVLATAAAAAIGYAHLTWRVHPSPNGYNELHLGAVGLLTADAYVVLGLASIVAAAAGSGRRRSGWSSRPGRGGG